MCQLLTWFLHQRIKNAHVQISSHRIQQDRQISQRCQFRTSRTSKHLKVYNLFSWSTTSIENEPWNLNRLPCKKLSINLKCWRNFWQEFAKSGSLADFCHLGKTRLWLKSDLCCFFVLFESCGLTKEVACILFSVSCIFFLSSLRKLLGCGRKCWSCDGHCPKIWSLALSFCFVVLCACVCMCTRCVWQLNEWN